ncbi:MAG: S8 family peptidase [Anaerolineae bacterium]
MKYRPSLRVSDLITILLLLILVPVAVTQAQDMPDRNPPLKARGHAVRAKLDSGRLTIFINSPTMPTRPFTPTLGGIPNALTFTYSIPDQQLLPAAHRVTPLNVGNDDPLTWTVAALGSWLTAAPLTGTTPASFWIMPTIFGTGMTAFYTAAITVTVMDPLNTENSPHRIDLNLQVVSTSLNHVYLPLTLRNHTPPHYPNDPFYDYQWAWETIEAPAAWGYSRGQGVLIAVVDTGTDLNHPDLASKVRTDIDYDFVNDDNEAEDDHGHGTHVSGIAAAATNNSVGVAGLGWEATILPLKVINQDGNGDTTDLAEAIRYATDNGADVINMSIGGTTDPCCDCPSSVQAAADYAHANGVVLVAASGNHGGDVPNVEMFPANCEHVLGIAATERDDSTAVYSNYGTHVSVAAPGSGIYSTLRGATYGYKQGTSMATPHVAGLAALLRARYPSYTPDEIASAILDNADDVGGTGWNPYSGCGRINAHNSLLQGKQGDSPLCLPGVGPWTANDAEATPKTAVTVSFVPGEIIVSFRPGTENETTIRRYGTGIEFLPEIEAWRLLVPSGQEQAALAQLRADPAVAHAELNYLVFAQ